MTISGLNRGAPKDIMNGLLAVRWLPPAAAGSNARRGRGSKSSTHPAATQDLCATPGDTAPPPIHRAKQPELRAATCSPQPACRRPCCQKASQPELTTMASLPTSTGKHAAVAFTGLMGGEGTCEYMRKLAKLRERTNALRAFRHRSARRKPHTPLLNTTTQPPPPHSPD